MPEDFDLRKLATDLLEDIALIHYNWGPHAEGKPRGEAIERILKGFDDACNIKRQTCTAAVAQYLGGVDE